jgi:hypothetical protein
MPFIDSLWIYPIKALDGVKVDRSDILQNGALAHDRAYALFDSSGTPINGKRTTAIHRLRARYNLVERIVTLREEEASLETSFHLEHDRASIEQWFSEHLKMAVILQHNPSGGYPDDENAPGPTLASLESYENVRGWFPNLSINELFARFRSNIIITGGGAFWEDRILGTEQQVVSIRIGEAIYEIVGPSSRCVVPTRDSKTGEPDERFQKTFSKMRKRTMHKGVHLIWFDHYYKFALNLRPVASKHRHQIKLGDEVIILNVRQCG